MQSQKSAIPQHKLQLQVECNPQVALPEELQKLRQELESIKLSKAALQRSEERLRCAIEANALGLWDWNLVTDKTYYDLQWKQMLGYEVEEIENTHQSFVRLVHPEDLPRVMAVLNAYLQGHTPVYEVEFRMRCKSGKWKWILDRGKVFEWDESGNPLRIIGTHQDISKDARRTLPSADASEECNRVLAEMTKQESQQPLDSILSSLNDVVWSVSASTLEVLYLNGATQTVYGRPVGEFFTRPHLWLEVVYPEDRERVNSAFQQMLETGKLEIEYRIVRPTGEVRCLQVRGSARCEAGYSRRFDGIATDITERKQAEEALRKQSLRQRLLIATQERIHSCVQLEEVLKTAVQEVRQFLQTDRTIIYRLNPDGGGAVTVESVGTGCIPILGMNIPDNCFTETYLPLYEQGRIRAIVDIYNCGLSQCHINLLSRFQVKANLVVPILQGNKLWGLLIAHHCRGSRKWLGSEIESIRQLSVQIAIAIQQSILLQQAQTEIAERQLAEARETEKANQLKIALEELQNTQRQLVQSEKMASLGQLVSGLAHEINNPVSFIYGNIAPASEYAQDLIRLVELYQQYYPTPPVAIAAEIELLDLDFLKTDFLKVLWSMRAGAERVKEIVLALRNFSGDDHANRKKADLHEGLNSTLTILQHRLKEQPNRPAIEVIQEYGDLPLVECYPGELNQVFMNILTNAIDALEERMKEGYFFTPKIWIRTELIKSHLSLVNSNDPIKPEKQQGTRHKAVIRISDNGRGILPHIQKHIFDPFFTTKPAGKGTGLGLLISHQIIAEKHQGKLKCNSQVGQGTEFVIEMNTKAKSNANIQNRVSF